MKKYIAKIAAVCLCLIWLAGCGGAMSQPDSEGSASSLPSSSSSEAVPASSLPGSQQSGGASSEVSSSKGQYSNPFDPFTPVPMPEPPYTLYEGEKLEGKWEHYLNPDYTDVKKATYQFGFEKESITVSLGVYETDLGLYFTGSYGFVEPGLLKAEVYYTQMGEEVNPEQSPKTTLWVLVQASDKAPDILLFTIQKIEGNEPLFYTAFQPILGLSLPYLNTSAGGQ